MRSARLTNDGWVDRERHGTEREVQVGQLHGVNRRRVGGRLAGRVVCLHFDADFRLRGRVDGQLDQLVILDIEHKVDIKAEMEVAVGAYNAQTELQRLAGTLRVAVVVHCARSMVRSFS